MRYRVDELAARAGLSVDTVRFYQTKGLLQVPEREGRVAWYSDDHLERLGRIGELKAKGFPLEVIRRLLATDIDAADEALIVALAGPVPGEPTAEAEEMLTLDELARRTGVSPALLEAIAREGLLVPRSRNGDDLYSAGDVSAVGAGLTLLEAGLPLSELLALARDHNQAMENIAERAVDLFVRFIRDPIQANSAGDREATEDLVAAFHKMFDAISALVTHHFRRVLLAQALARIEREGDASEIAAVHAESARRLD